MPMRKWIVFIACIMMGLAAGQCHLEQGCSQDSLDSTVALLQLGSERHVQRGTNEDPMLVGLNPPDFRADAVKNEDACQLISSRGLMYSCTVRPNQGVSDTNKLMLLAMNASSLQSLGMQHFPADIAVHGDGVIVYVVTAALPAFIDQVLPGINNTFKLVTGDADRGPINVLGDSLFKMLVNHDKLIHWFGQNAVDNEAANPKFTQIPIGLDYHTLKHHATGWGPQASPTAQEAELLAKRRAAPEFAHRTAKAFWSGGMSSRLRQSAITQLPLSFVDTAGSMRRAAVWEKMAGHQFVISPPGNGIDCHRTWEAIALGSIPIVSKRLSSLYVDNGFPVVAIGDNDWEDLASPDMQKRLKEVATKAQKKMPPAMYLDYWVQKFRQA